MKRCKRHSWSEWAETLITWEKYQMERLEARFCRECGKVDVKPVRIETLTCAHCDQWKTERETERMGAR